MIDQRVSKSNPKQPDYTCQDVNCLNDKGYRTGVWLKNKTPAVTGYAQQMAPKQPFTQRPAALTPEPAMPWEPDTKDAAICALFWNSVDAVLAGIAQRKLTDGFTSDNICSLVATVFIARSRR